MFVVILNWKIGENDPFTAFNQVLASYLEACGKCTRTVQLTDENWPSQVLALKDEGIDFVFTWQGLGTRLVTGEQNQSFWDVLQVPLIILHGDHPCHMPANHALDSRYCAHLYGTREFCSYASRHFRKQSRAITIDVPLFNLDAPLDTPGADCFVLLKNITPPIVLENQWRAELGKRPFDCCMAAVEVLKSMLVKENHLDVHETIDNLIVKNNYEEFSAMINPTAYHGFHSMLDFYIRNTKTVSVLAELQDIPLHIIGRGWESYARAGNPNHQFFRGNNLANSQRQYYSKYGIIDVTPSKTGLHDRTLRAMRNERPFLSSGYLPEFLPNMYRYDPLFYRFNENNLREKCEAVVSDPQAHTELAIEFSYLYQMRCQPTEFVWKLDSLARSIDRR